jgi:hypothetical protein
VPQPMQTYATHRRYFPLYHFFVLPIAALNVVITAADLVRRPSLRDVLAFLIALCLLAGFLAARTMTLVVQNRLIGLEMRLRLAAVLEPDLARRIPELRLRHLIALRFASDAEVPDLVRRCLAGEFASGEDVKREIRQWRPDFVRA